MNNAKKSKTEAQLATDRVKAILNQRSEHANDDATDVSELLADIIHYCNSTPPYPGSDFESKLRAAENYVATDTEFEEDVKSARVAGSPKI
jgi:hypothetical protein